MGRSLLAVVVLLVLPALAQAQASTPRFKMPYTNTDAGNTDLNTIDTNMRSSSYQCFTEQAVLSASGFCGPGTGLGGTIATSGNCSATENLVATTVPIFTKFANLWCDSPVTPGAAAGWAVTIDTLVAGTGTPAASTVTCCVGGGCSVANATTFCNDTTHVGSLNAGDTFDFAIVKTGAPSASALTCCVEFAQGGLP